MAFRLTRSIVALLFGGALLIALIVINLNPSPPSLHLQFALFVLGLAALVWGAGGFTWNWPDIPRRHILLLTLLTLLALALRLWRSEQLVHLFVDELNFVEGLNQVRRGGDLYLLHRFDWVAAFPYLYPYLQNGGVALLGNNLAGLRAFSAVVGALTVPATYVLARAWVDGKTSQQRGRLTPPLNPLPINGEGTLKTIPGRVIPLYPGGKETSQHYVPLIAAAVLATFPPHIQFSRFALINIVDPLFGALALAFLARGLRDGRQADFAVGGAMLGLTQYFYEGGRLLLPALIAVWLIGLMVTRRVRLQQVGLFVLTATFAALPFYAVMLGQGYSFLPRLGAKGFAADYWRGVLLATGGESNFSAHLQHILGTFSHYAFTPDASFYYGGTLPLILPHLSLFFLLGVFATLWRGPRLLLLWLVGASMGNSLLTTGAWASGLVVTFPALALLTALGIWEAWQFIACRLRPQVHSFIRRAALIALALALAVQVIYYFGFHLDGYNQQVRLWTDYQDAVFRSIDFEPGTAIHIVGQHEFYDWDKARMLEFLGRPDLEINVRQHGTIWAFDAAYLESLSPLRDHAFFIEAADTDSLELLRQYFDLETPSASPFFVPESLQFVLYYAPAG